MRTTHGQAALKEHLDFKTTAGLELTALDGAAVRGHTSTIRVLVSCHQDPQPLPGQHCSRQEKLIVLPNTLLALAGTYSSSTSASDTVWL